MAEIDIREINRAAKEDAERLIRGSEDQYKSFVEKIVTRVAKNSDIRIILLAGPSGSGKTTTANLLADGIRRTGLVSSVISLDNYYRDATDPVYPRLPNGERDFEAVEALNLDELEKLFWIFQRAEIIRCLTMTSRSVAEQRLINIRKFYTGALLSRGFML